MLPTHRPQIALEHLFKLTSKSSCGLNRFAVRWITLAGLFGIGFWFFIPFVRNVSWGSPEFDFYPPSLPPHIRPLSGPIPLTLEEQQKWDQRKNEVKESFKHAWNGYRDRAFPSDELLPLSGGKTNK